MFVRIAIVFFQRISSFDSKRKDVLFVSMVRSSDSDLHNFYGPIEASSGGQTNQKMKAPLSNMVNLSSVFSPRRAFHYQVKDRFAVVIASVVFIMIHSDLSETCLESF